MEKTASAATAGHTQRSDHLQHVIEHRVTVEDEARVKARARDQQRQPDPRRRQH